MPRSNSARFATLASAMRLTPNSATLLAVIAQHRRADDDRIKKLMERLDGPARQVAELLVTDPSGSVHDATDVAQMAELLRLWGDVSGRA